MTGAEVAAKSSAEEAVPPPQETDADAVVELSAEEALALLAAMKGKTPPGPAPAGATSPPATEPARRRVRSILGAQCYVLAFESQSVEPAMRVAGTTVARLYSMVRAGELNVELGPICQSLEEFVEAWDLAAEDEHVVVLANLNGAGGFLSAVSAQRPGVAGAYWVVYETLRSEVSSTTSGFLAELRSRNRAKAIGYGPRNLLEAARRGAEAVRGHVEWGFGRAASLAVAG